MDIAVALTILFLQSECTYSLVKLHSILFLLLLIRFRHQWLRTNSYGWAGGLSFAFRTIPNEDYLYKVNYGNTLRVYFVDD